MPRGGSKPGERRGGRKKGSKNRDVSPLITRMQQDIAQARAEDRPQAKDILQKYMLLFHGMAARFQLPPPNQQWKLDPQTGQPALDANGRPIPTNPHANEDMFWKCADHALACAKELVKYESPQFRSVVMQGDPNAPVQAVTRIERVFVNPPKHIELDAIDLADDSFGSRPN